MRWGALTAGALIWFELSYLIRVFPALFEMAKVSLHWPHVIADSAVFLSQAPLHEGLNGWLQLLDPINEHRLVVSRALAVLPVSFGFQLGQWSVLVSMALLGLTWLMFALSLLRLRFDAPLLDRIAVVLAMALVLFNPWQAENLIWDINVHWFLQGFLVAVAVFLMLARSEHLPCWFDLLLPGLALFNGGQGVCVLLAVALPRLVLYGRRWLFLASAISFLGVDRLLGGHSAQAGYSFSGVFSARLLSAWWPNAGWWLIVAVIVVAVGLLRAWPGLLPSDTRQLLICSIPISYAALFAVAVHLSRSSISDGLFSRSGYVTPALMLGVGLLLLLWKFLRRAHCCSGAFDRSSFGWFCCWGLSPLGQLESA